MFAAGSGIALPPKMRCSVIFAGAYVAQHGKLNTTLLRVLETCTHDLDIDPIKIKIHAMNVSPAVYIPS